MPPCPCRRCKVARAIAATAWIGLAVGVLAILFAVTGCGTVADQHGDFPDIPAWWEQ